jgi:uncharacterized protein
MWLLIGLAVVWLVKGLRRPTDPPKSAEPAPPPARSPRTAAPAAVQLMVRCAHCGVHLPGRDAVSGTGDDYCSPAHRDAGPRPAARD